VCSTVDDHIQTQEERFVFSNPNKRRDGRLSAVWPTTVSVLPVWLLTTARKENVGIVPSQPCCWICLEIIYFLKKHATNDLFGAKKKKEKKEEAHSKNRSLVFIQLVCAIKYPV
jgi:hypothetical protein